MIKIFLILFISLNIFAYDEQREIDLMHGIKITGKEYKKYYKQVEKWSKNHNLAVPRFILIRTTPMRVQGYYSAGIIEVRFSDKQSDDDILATLSHEFGHYYFDKKNKKFNLREEEIQADLLSAKLIGKDKVIDSLKKRKMYHSNGIHPSIKQRIKLLKEN